MRREDKYKDTEWFTYFNANPHNRKSGDCVIRAIAYALGQSWEQTVQELTEISLRTGYVLNDKKCYEKYLDGKAIKYKQPRKDDGTKYTGVEFCKLQQLGDMVHEDYADGVTIGKRIIAHIGGHHLVAIVNGKVFDIWDSTAGCIGNYWIVKE